MLKVHTTDPVNSAIDFCKEIKACIGTCRITDKVGNRVMVLGTTPGKSMELLWDQIVKNKKAMTQKSVFDEVPAVVTEHSLFTIVFENIDS